MPTRRNVLLGAAAAAFAAAPARAADEGKAKYPELVFAVIKEADASAAADRWTPFVEYLSKQIGVKVTLRVANDYAAMIAGQSAGAIHLAYYAPAAMARALIIGVPTEAFAIDVNNDGSRGYYSVFYVLAKSPYQRIEDLKGKGIGFVDANSTSGNNMPRFVLNGLGIDPETYFSKTIFTGSHENAVLDLAEGAVDVAANWWNNAGDSNLIRMLNAGLLKNADGSLMSKDDFRIVLTSPMIINSPYAYRSDIPDDGKSAIRQAFFDAAAKAPEAFAKLSGGLDKPWAPASNADYEDTVRLVKFVDSLRRKKS